VQLVKEINYQSTEKVKHDGQFCFTKELLLKALNKEGK
jgi:hypothetical protein